MWVIAIAWRAFSTIIGAREDCCCCETSRRGETIEFGQRQAVKSTSSDLLTLGRWPICSVSTSQAILCSLAVLIAPCDASHALSRQRKLGCNARRLLDVNAHYSDLVMRLVSLIRPHVLNLMNDIEASGCSSKNAARRQKVSKIPSLGADQHHSPVLVI